MGLTALAFDEKLGGKILESANRSAIVIGTGLGAAALTLNPGAGIAAGVATGAAYDGVHSAAAGKP